MIQKRFGVTYHVDYIGTLLHKLGWSVQKPEQRARERDDALIKRWQQVEWPRIKKGAEQKASVVFLDESGFMLQPLRRRTWGARPDPDPVRVGPPRPLERDRRVEPGPSGLATAYFRLHDHNIVADDVVEFVKQLHRQLGRKLILVWDRWSAHRSAARRLSRYPWLQVEWLPAYAPELNPVESMWNHTKYSDLANFIPDDAQHLGQAIRSSITHQRNDAYLKHSFSATHT